ncbi:sensor histidine kinase [Clostridium cylindrosporum]|uniref:histidine kinase n=1 Tax=Clostridium cylindrosporum DSM 605 TaxID=1121307 RepID=A0A0J8G4Z6_CLOCY|nr:HAMP domain-containing sensor histidine kinase [Clostridium cylindrosporum]KMT22746.1 sensor histidine kinase ResE [Clostridium cylindrosporum DSM 605]
MQSCEYLSNYSKKIEITPLFVCSVDIKGNIYSSLGEAEEIFRQDSEISIDSNRLILKTNNINKFSEVAYKRLFECIDNIIKTNMISEETVYVYVGNFTGTWYQVDIKKDPINEDRVTLIWFYSSYLENSNENTLDELKIYKHLSEFLPYSMCIYVNNKIRFINYSAIKFLGGECWSEFIGRRFSEFISAESTFNIEEIVNGINSRNIPNIVYREKIRTLDLSEYDVDMYISPIVFNGEKGVLLAFRDMEVRKEVKELEELINTKNKELDKTIKSEKMKTEFFTDVSHELRTPLNVILGALQLLSFQMDKGNINDENGKLNEYLTIVRFNALRLLRLVNNIIDITKIDSGFKDIQLKKCNIVSFVEEITNSVIPYMENKDINLTFDTNDEEIHILMDPSKMERVILNILSNAIKFTHEGGEVFVNINSGENVNISIKDSGIGMSEDKINVIFERFRQVSNGYVRENEGSGIGLSLAKSIIEQHGGNIKVHSEINVGSEFIITLPKNKLSDNIEEFNLNEYQIGAVDLELSDICYQK